MKLMKGYNKTKKRFVVDSSDSDLCSESSDCDHKKIDLKSASMKKIPQVEDSIEEH